MIQMGNTAVTNAACSGDLKLVQLLHSNGAIIDVANNVSRLHGWFPSTSEVLLSRTISSK